VKVATWNVNGIRARSAQVLEWVTREQPDVLCLQEVKASPDKVPGDVSDLPGYFTYWHGHKGYSGVALHVRREWARARPSFSHPPFDHENRIVVARAGTFLFASIYVPNGGKDFDAKLRFLEALIAFVEAEKAAGTTMVLCGDLNVALEERDVHPTMREPEQIGQTAHERELLSRIITGGGLVDLHRKFRPDDDRLFTWWAPWRNMRERNMGWRLDYVLVSSPLAEAAKSCEVHRTFGTSDHGVVQAEIDVAPPVFEGAPDSTSSGTEPKPPAGQLRLLL
jgi:exodeoxyribonuclease-3